MKGGDHVQEIVAGGRGQIAERATAEGGAMAAEIVVEEAGVCRGEGHVHLVASRRLRSWFRESRKDRHLDGYGRGTSRDSDQSAWNERRYVSSSERPGASHFPRACLLYTSPSPRDA